LKENFNKVSFRLRIKYVLRLKQNEIHLTNSVITATQFMRRNQMIYANKLESHYTFILRASFKTV